MGLDFTENEKAPAPVDFYNPDSKARPQHLEGEVIPELIHRVRAPGQTGSRGGASAGPRAPAAPGEGSRVRAAR